MSEATHSLDAAGAERSPSFVRAIWRDGLVAAAAWGAGLPGPGRIQNN